MDVATYRDHLAAVKREINEISPKDAAERLTAEPRPVLLDVRERDEWEQGHIPGAIHIPRGNLESRIDNAVPDRAAPVIVYCAAGNRSAYAAKTLNELGFGDVLSISGGFTQWKQNGHEWKTPRTLSAQQLERYSRHTLIPEVGEEGQLKLLDSKVLLIGAGGLGSPAAMYLAAAGVGTLGIIDGDVVDRSNLQRQILHTEDRIGMAKVDSAEKTLKALNPEVKVVKYTERMTSENVMDVITGYDVIVDGTDNFPTRYLLNDASLVANIPVVHGSIYQFEGSVTVYAPRVGPCYRCQYPEPPPPELAPSCAEGGVLGVLPGVVGTLQATEAIKLLLGVGDPLIGRQLRYDALSMEFVELRMHRDPQCPVCSKDPDQIHFIDYEQFCAAPVRATRAVPTIQEAVA
ncbi:MAG: sulfur-carrier protein adenylyltransferase/sulfurtransferase [Gaiellales bacterium]|jgi:molybdopterin/thiamine biosynthesis adenylyltransferase/rhodanese-related sulfurtransferase|nr:sulfur-carrier protein adenylyltransferase/sulfurtransferase [Gaiellales bacterium]